MTTRYIPTAGGTIADLDSGTAADRKLATTWGAGLVATVLAHNASDAVAYITTAADATASGRGIGPGQTVALGPYLAGVDLWAYGLGTGSLHYSVEIVASEG